MGRVMIPILLLALASVAQGVPGSPLRGSVRSTGMAPFRTILHDWR